MRKLIALTMCFFIFFALVAPAFALAQLAPVLAPEAIYYVSALLVALGISTTVLETPEGRKLAANLYNASYENGQDFREWTNQLRPPKHDLEYIKRRFGGDGYSGSGRWQNPGTGGNKQDRTPIRVPNKFLALLASMGMLGNTLYPWFASWDSASAHPTGWSWEAPAVGDTITLTNFVSPFGSTARYGGRGAYLMFDQYQWEIFDIGDNWVLKRWSTTIGTYSKATYQDMTFVTTGTNLGVAYHEAGQPGNTYRFYMKMASYITSGLPPAYSGDRSIKPDGDTWTLPRGVPDARATEIIEKVTEIEESGKDAIIILPKTDETGAPIESPDSTVTLPVVPWSPDIPFVGTGDGSEDDDVSAPIHDDSEWEDRDRQQTTLLQQILGAIIDIPKKIANTFKPKIPFSTHQAAISDAMDGKFPFGVTAQFNEQTANSYAPVWTFQVTQFGHTFTIDWADWSAWVAWFRDLTSVAILFATSLAILRQFGYFRSPV